MFFSGDFKIMNVTWDGLYFQNFTFGVCRGISSACPDSSNVQSSVCPTSGTSSLCQTWNEGSFCVSKWDNAPHISLDQNGDRGLSLMYHVGDYQPEMRKAPAMVMNIVCDHSVTDFNMDEISIAPDFNVCLINSFLSLIFVYFDHLLLLFTFFNISILINYNVLVFFQEIQPLYYVTFRHEAACPTSVLLPQTPNPTTPSHGISGAIVAVISIAFLLIGLAGGAVAAVAISKKLGWFNQNPPSVPYSQFELDDDI